MRKKTKNPYFNKRRAKMWEDGYHDKGRPALFSEDFTESDCNIYNQGLKAGYNDRDVIPEGIYCYNYVKDENGDFKYNKCPYWRMKSHKKQIGYCSFLDKDDMEINGLLFDQCKECAVKYDSDVEEV